MLILFDLDGTLVESGKKITNKMSDTLEIIKKKYNCIYGIVGGGNFTKIIYQLDEYNNLFDYIFSECGAVIYKNINNSFECIFKKSMMEIIEKNDIMKKELELIINKFMDLILESNIRISGNNIDVRSGLIYLSIPGMNANDQIRNEFFEYDKNTNFIKKILSELKMKCKHFDIVKGGSAGFSLTLPGWNKSQILDMSPNILTNINNIYFFGDKCDTDGNDYPLYSHPLIKGNKVKDYNDTINQLQKLFID